MTNWPLVLVAGTEGAGTAGSRRVLATALAALQLLQDQLFWLQA